MPRLALVALLVALLLAAAAQAQTIVWDKYDPMAVRTNRTADVVLEAQTSGTVSGIRLDYSNGGSLTLTRSGPGHWVASVPAAKVLDGYAADDVNHNFVGFLRLLASDGSTLASYNSFIQIVDNLVPSVTIRTLGGNARATARALNLYRPAIDADHVQTAAQQFYGYFHDDYDFLQIIYTEPSYPGNRYHFAVRNDVDGIGETKFNQAPSYGSAGKLQGITVFPVDFFFDPGETAFSHELGHQWVLFLKNSALLPGPHWPPSTMAHGVMGFNIPGRLRPRPHQAVLRRHAGIGARRPAARPSAAPPSSKALTLHMCPRSSHTGASRRSTPGVRTSSDARFRDVVAAARRRHGLCVRHSHRAGPVRSGQSVHLHGRSGGDGWDVADGVDRQPATPHGGARRSRRPSARRSLASAGHRLLLHGKLRHGGPARYPGGSSRTRT